MKTIVCTGDSHTWGQGAEGAVSCFSPPVVAGDLRLMPFHFPSYVSLLRERVNRETGSTAYDLEGTELFRTAQGEVSQNCVVVTDSPFTLDVGMAGIVRIEFMGRDTPSQAELYMDGKGCGTVDLHMPDSTNPYIITALFCDQRVAHRLQIKSSVGSVFIYRIEVYKGEFAVINSGIGSCPTEKFMDVYWNDYVMQYKPSILIMEAHTINDWLTRESPEVYYKNLVLMIRKAKREGVEPVMLTVSPILGEQAQPFNEAEYLQFVEMSRLAALHEGIPLADANQCMADMLERLTSTRKQELLFDDPWHVNNKGHQLYEESIWRVLKNQRMI